MSTGDNKPPAAPDTRVIGQAGAPAGGRSANTDDVETFVVATSADRPVARLEVVAGPGKGQHRQVHTGTSSIGRDTQSNRIALDFGDTFLSRVGHAILIHDGRANSFRLVDGGKANGVKVNGRQIAGECAVKFGDQIELGQTLLKLGAP